MARMGITGDNRTAFIICLIFQLGTVSTKDWLRNRRGKEYTFTSNNSKNCENFLQQLLSATYRQNIASSITDCQSRIDKLCSALSSSISTLWLIYDWLLTSSAQLSPQPPEQELVLVFALYTHHPPTLTLLSCFSAPCGQIWASEDTYLRFELFSYSRACHSIA